MAGRLRCDAAHEKLYRFHGELNDFGPVDVHLSSDNVAQASDKGDIVMLMRTRQRVKKGVFTNVWHIPNLISKLVFSWKLYQGR